MSWLFAQKCENCGDKPKRPGHNYCSKPCADEAEAKRRSMADAKFRAAIGYGGGTAGGNIVDEDDVCEECHARPKSKQRDFVTGKIITHAFCGRACKDNNTRRRAEAARQMLMQRQQQAMNNAASASGEQAAIASGSSEQRGSYSITYPCCKATLTTVLSPPPTFCPLCMLSNLQKYTSQAAGLTGDMTSPVLAPTRSTPVPQQNIPAATPAAVKPSPSRNATEQPKDTTKVQESELDWGVPDHLAGSNSNRVLPTRRRQTVDLQGSPWAQDHVTGRRQGYDELGEDGQFNSAFATAASRSYLIRRTIVEEFSAVDEPEDYGLPRTGNANQIPAYDEFDEEG